MDVATIVGVAIHHAMNHRRDLFVAYEFANALLVHVEVLVARLRGIRGLLDDRILCSQAANERDAHGEHVRRETSFTFLPFVYLVVNVYGVFSIFAIDVIFAFDKKRSFSQRNEVPLEKNKRHFHACSRPCYMLQNDENPLTSHNVYNSKSDRNGSCRNVDTLVTKTSYTTSRFFLRVRPDIKTPSIS